MLANINVALRITAGSKRLPRKYCSTIIVDSHLVTLDRCCLIRPFFQANHLVTR